MPTATTIHNSSPNSAGQSQLPLSLSVSFTNITSLLPKRDALCSFLDDSNSDIVALTETWLTPEIGYTEVFPDDSSDNIYRRDRRTRRGGGVL